ncbi:hypothetical protein GCM10009706_29840 [Curtobacterium citreum]|nr:hypothetical protein GCM10009706_29840 [Curtobacterium citreum]
MRMRSAVAAMGALVCAATLFLTGCTNDTNTTADPTSSARASRALVDPMVQLRDKSHDFYTDATPVLHESGTGTTTFTVSNIPAGTKQITYYVSCSPVSHYTVTMGKHFEGPCTYIVSNSGGIPIASAADTSVTITLPASTRFWIVGIPDSN